MDCGSGSNAGVVSSNNIDLSKVMEKIRISYQEMLMSIDVSNKFFAFTQHSARGREYIWAVLLIVL